MGIQVIKWWADMIWWFCLKIDNFVTFILRKRDETLGEHFSSNHCLSCPCFKQSKLSSDCPNCIYCIYIIFIEWFSAVVSSWFGQSWIRIGIYLNQNCFVESLVARQNLESHDRQRWLTWSPWSAELVGINIIKQHRSHFDLNELSQSAVMTFQWETNINTKHTSTINMYILMGHKHINKRQTSTVINYQLYIFMNWWNPHRCPTSKPSSNFARLLAPEESRDVVVGGPRSMSWRPPLKRKGKNGRRPNRQPCHEFMVKWTKTWKKHLVRNIHTTQDGVLWTVCGMKFEYFMFDRHR